MPESLDYILSDYSKVYHYRTDLKDPIFLKTLLDLHYHNIKLISILQKLVGFYDLTISNHISISNDIRILKDDLLFPLSRMLCNTQDYISRPNDGWFDKDTLLDLVNKNLSEICTSLTFMDFTSKKFQRGEFKYAHHLPSGKWMSPTIYTMIEYLIIDTKRLQYGGLTYFKYKDTTPKFDDFNANRLLDTTIVLSYNEHINTISKEFLSIKAVKGYLLEKFTFHNNIKLFLKKVRNSEAYQGNDEKYLSLFQQNYDTFCEDESLSNYKKFIENPNNFSLMEFSEFFRIKSPIEHEYNSTFRFVPEYHPETSKKMISLVFKIFVNFCLVAESYQSFCEFVATHRVHPELTKHGQYLAVKFYNISNDMRNYITILGDTQNKNPNVSEDFFAFHQLTLLGCELYTVIVHFNETLLKKVVEDFPNAYTNNDVHEGLQEYAYLANYLCSSLVNDYDPDFDPLSQFFVSTTVKKPQQDNHNSPLNPTVYSILEESINDAYGSQVSLIDFMIKSFILEKHLCYLNYHFVIGSLKIVNLIDLFANTENVDVSFINYRDLHELKFQEYTKSLASFHSYKFGRGVLAKFESNRQTNNHRNINIYDKRYLDHVYRYVDGLSESLSFWISDEDYNAIEEVVDVTFDEYNLSVFYNYETMETHKPLVDPLTNSQGAYFYA